MPENLSQKPLDQWTPEDVKMAAGSGLPSTYAVARAMLEDHDYFQGGKLWVGQKAEAGLSTEQMRRIKDVFVPDPLLEEIRENRTNGLLQREAGIGFNPTKPPEEQPESADGEEEVEEGEDPRVAQNIEALANWWDKKGLWPKVREAFGRTIYSRRAALRVYPPVANTQEVLTADGKTVRAFKTVGTLAEALDNIEIEAPLPDLAGRFTLESQQQVAVVLTGDENNRTAELWSVETDAAGVKKTVARVMNARRFGDAMSGKPAPVLTVPYDLGGRLPVVEMKTAELVTDPIIRQQSLLSLSSTILECVLEKAGFPERIFTNAEPPGLWFPFPPDGEPPIEDALDVNGNTIYKHRRPWVFGFSSVTELIGLKTLEASPAGAEPRQTFATPTAQRFDPVDPVYVKTAREMIRTTIYKNCRQGHFATESTAEASGVAYQQHRAQFEADLLTLKGLLEGLIRDVLEVVLAYAGLMHAETKTFLEQFRCVVTLHVTSGPITPDEARLAQELRDARVISQDTCMLRVGIEDATAEQEAIGEDRHFEEVDGLLDTLRRSGLSSPTLETKALLAKAERLGFLEKKADKATIERELKDAVQERNDRKAQAAAALAAFEAQPTTDNGDTPPGSRFPAAAGAGT